MLPDATAYHRRPVRLLNRVLRGFSTVGLARFELNSEVLLARARRDTGLHDFGDEGFVQPMQLLIDSLENEANLNPVGRFMHRANILRLLKHRLYVQDLVTRHPEILERDIPDPVVVVGLARSGTTRLHRLLASDSHFLHLKSWESVYPVPWPACFVAREAGRPDPRIAALDQGLKAVLYMSPQIAAVHPLGTFEVEEEVGLIQHGFSSQLFEIQAKIPSFAEWLMSRGPRFHSREWLVVSVPLLLVTGLQVLFNQTDIIMLGSLASSGETGIYAAAARTARLVLFGLTAINAVAAPMISEAFHSGRMNEMEGVLRLITRILAVFTLVMVAAFVIGGKFVLRLFGPEFTMGYGPMLILVAAQAFNSLCGPVAYLMTMTGNQNMAARIVAVSAGLNILLNALLIPSWGIWGAALATATSIVFWNTWMLVSVRRRLDVNPSAFRRWSP